MNWNAVDLVENEADNKLAAASLGHHTVGEVVWWRALSGTPIFRSCAERYARVASRTTIPAWPAQAATFTG